MADLVDEVFGTPATEPLPEPTPEPQAEPVAPEPQPEPPAPTPEPRDDERHVPLRTFLDTRDEAKEWKRKYEAAQAAAPQPPKQVPDSYDDPEAYDAYVRGEMSAALQKQKIDISFAIEADKHGEAKVLEARDWAVQKAGEDPLFRAQLEQAMNTENLPLSWIVRQHKRDAVVSAIPSDVSSLDELIEREIARRGLTATAQAAPVIPTVPASAVKPAAPPRSIASDAAASAPSNSDPNASFMAIFDKR